MQDLGEKKLQKSDLVEGNEEKGADSGTAVESSSQSLAASREGFLSFFLCSLLFSLIPRHTRVGLWQNSTSTSLCSSSVRMTILMSVVNWPRDWASRWWVLWCVSVCIFWERFKWGCWARGFRWRWWWRAAWWWRWCHFQHWWQGGGVYLFLNFWVKQYAHLHHPALPFAMPFWLWSWLQLSVKEILMWLTCFKLVLFITAVCVWLCSLQVWTQHLNGLMMYRILHHPFSR